MTTQIPDRMRWNRRVYELFSEPLEPFFNAQNPRPDAFAPMCSACWRGYFARWSIKRDKLYLEKLEPFLTEYVSAEATEFGVGETIASRVPVLSKSPNFLAQLFPQQKAPVFASWYSGELVYVPVGLYANWQTSEEDASAAAGVLVIEHGCVVSRP